MKKSKIFFTGGNGFLGKELIPSLRKCGYEVISPSSKELNLLDTSSVDQFFLDNRFDIIIHSAICGGRRLKKDESSIFYDNIRIFENIFRYSNSVDKFINFDSGASLINTDNVPDTPYGLSKYSIARSVKSIDNGVNLRLYGCFGIHEKSDRFFSTNIKNYVERNPIIIFKDRLMDFIYSKDVFKILEYSLSSDISDYECVYNQKYYLSDLSEMINELSDHKVDIIIQDKEEDPPYCGIFNDINLEYLGLEKGIGDLYENFC